MNNSSNSVKNRLSKSFLKSKETYCSRNQKEKSVPDCLGPNENKPGPSIITRSPHNLSSHPSNHADEPL